MDKYALQYLENATQQGDAEAQFILPKVAEGEKYRAAQWFEKAVV